MLFASLGSLKDVIGIFGFFGRRCLHILGSLEDFVCIFGFFGIRCSHIWVLWKMLVYRWSCFVHYLGRGCWSRFVRCSCLVGGEILRRDCFYLVSIVQVLYLHWACLWMRWPRSQVTSPHRTESTASAACLTLATCDPRLTACESRLETACPALGKKRCLAFTIWPLVPSLLSNHTKIMISGSRV